MEVLCWKCEQHLKAAFCERPGDGNELRVAPGSAGGSWVGSAASTCTETPPPLRVSQQDGAPDCLGFLSAGW